MYYKKYIHLHKSFKRTTKNRIMKRINTLIHVIIGLPSKIGDRKLQITNPKLQTTAPRNTPIGNTNNTLTILPNYLKKPVRFWSTNIGNEIRSTFNLELYAKVCESKGLSCEVKVVGG